MTLSHLVLGAAAVALPAAAIVGAWAQASRACVEATHRV
jgi:hypothetical protein